jgi:hypothetical protein
MSGLVKFTHKGDFKKTLKFLENIKSKKIYTILDQYGQKGVDLLKASTPIRTGKTAASWSYRVVMEGDSVGIEWLNSNMANDGKTPVAILIQMGHGTRTGGYVPPRDYINPAMKPLFDEIVQAIDKAVKAL